MTITFDEDGQEGVSTVEAKKYPIFAVQFHPENVLANFNPQWNMPHSVSATLLSQEFGRFFVTEARKNSHQFPTEELYSLWLAELHPMWFLTKGGGFHYAEALLFDHARFK